MAIVGQVLVESRRYSGWIDPRYPIGYWMGRLAVTGNASGGNLGVDLLFQTAFPAVLNSQMYSVERFSITSTEAADRIVQIDAVNMGGPLSSGFTHQYAILIRSVGNVVDTGAALPQSQNLVPWFLGSQGIASTAASLSLLTTNLDGETFTLEAEGYRWSARSVLVDGGPQRPPTGPYR